MAGQLQHAGAELQARPLRRLEVDFKTQAQVAPADLDRIFQPFEQADSSLSRRYEGTGLGLALSRRLAELLGGTLTVTSTLGEGSQFTVTFPLVADDS